ncbi:c-type cytochrome [Niabella hibiscisoli]|uniref:c-type cytochrome n=1 Tax=Niabella hibiscisoli TaxID=1825928 RepID=UPI001F1006B6|nr:cytochrome c [Niabella hibiscisoli]MCH5715966.1 cytochrome c [Niabella hibiscisoli]
MNKYFYIAVVMLSAVAAGCGAGKDPGIAYMPDMYYSVAYETYAPTKSLKDSGIHYDRLPVPGTVSRSEDLAFHFDLKHDSLGYAQSAGLKNPLDSSKATVNLKEAERLYLINCGICHGAGLDGNGPLFKGGDGPYSAAPKDFHAADMVAMAPGTMFYSITFGKGQMGSYASQLTPKQRWEVVTYIKSKTAKKEAPAAAAPVDSTATAKN